MKLRGVYEVKTEKDRIQILANLIEEGSRSAKIRETALAIVKNCPSRDYLCELKSIFKWLQQNMRFVGDIKDVDTYHTAERILELKQLDCDDGCIIAGALAASIGYPILIKIISQGNKPFHHVYILVGSSPDDNPPRWYAMDFTRPTSRFGEEPRYKKSRVYKLIFEA